MKLFIEQNMNDVQRSFLATKRFSPPPGNLLKVLDLGSLRKSCCVGQVFSSAVFCILYWVVLRNFFVTD